MKYNNSIGIIQNLNRFLTDDGEKPVDLIYRSKIREVT